MPVDERFAYITLADGTQFQELKEVQVGVDERGAPITVLDYDEAATVAKMEAHLAPPAPTPVKK